MKNSNVNGQVLSEQEMREVKGGEVFEVTKPSPLCCPYCASTNIHFIEDTAYKYYCGNCRAHGEIDED